VSARDRVPDIYERLLRRYGRQGWWPAETAFEVMVGAILTQNTSWRNVESAITRLKRRNLMTPARVMGVSEADLATCIRSAGYYNVKARRLRSFVSYYLAEYNGSSERMADCPTEQLRAELLAVNGIGPETADSILLYALGHPVFVVDAYTRRLASCQGLAPPDAGYGRLQKVFEDGLPADPDLFNEFHALIVRHGKEYCRKRAPRCGGCPLEKPAFASESYSCIKYGAGGLK